MTSIIDNRLRVYCGFLSLKLDTDGFKDARCGTRGLISSKSWKLLSGFWLSSDAKKPRCVACYTACDC